MIENKKKIENKRGGGGLERVGEVFLPLQTLNPKKKSKVDSHKKIK